MAATTRILHLEDSRVDAQIIALALKKAGLICQVKVVETRDEFLLALRSDTFDVILCDSSIPGFDGLLAQEITRAEHPEIPFIFVSGYAADERPEELLRAAGDNYVSKAQLESIAPAIRRAIENRIPSPTDSPAASNSPGAAASVEPWQRQRAATELLVAAVQELSLARDLPTVMAIVRRAAREMTGADGASFVLRDGDRCYYAEENAIGPLWRGRRFPMSTCISGWAMLNRQAAVIEDIYADPRIPVDAYRPTFVKSLAMVPIRTAAPVGAIGNYWATTHRATDDEVQLLQALADSTSIAMENVQVYTELESRVAQRTAELQIANRELEAFSYSVSHDLRAPLRAIDCFSKFLEDECAESLHGSGRDYLTQIRTATQRMGQLVEDLLKLSRISRTQIVREPVDLSQMARDICTQLQAAAPMRRVACEIADGLAASGDPRLLRVALENLLSNAWKYSSKKPDACITFGSTSMGDGPTVFFVRDNGAGFNMQHASKLFGAFQRLHTDAEFPGTGVGLATVQRVVERHGGRVWAEAEVGRGATFFFTLS